MSDHPTGTVTFLFTDIEGSTKRWEQFPEQMQHALARHDILLREAIVAHGGYVFKTMGDAFCAAFSSTSDALNAALSAQRSTHGEDWGEVGPIRVRMALHTGATEERDGDYFGQPVNRVARLLSAGHGGQTLLSLSSFELVRDTLPEGIALRDMGERRLKDLIRPERIYQVVALDLPAEFAPLKTLDYRPNNLPAQPTALIGREKELADIATLLRTDNVRLVTLTGPGGTGKTRLGLQAAADLLDEFEHGVWLTDLSPITDHRLVVSEIAQALGVKEAGGKPLIESVKEYLRDRQMLLVLDNFEQVTPAAPDVAQLMQAAPNVKVLITSRAVLRLRGEKEYLVPPLALPDAKHLPPLEHLTQYDAVRLFIERALDVKPDFEVDNDNAPSVAEICVRLDGLPLAIELAAARIKILSPESMLTRLESRLRVLTGGARDLPARQQTLRSAIEWSYDLLEEGEQQLFRRLAVFQGGRTLEGLEAVSNYDGQLQLDVLDGVESLVSKSLLRQREGLDGEPRFILLETIHEYAREKLEESGEAQALQREHALYFMKLAEEADPHDQHLTGVTVTGRAEGLHWSEEEHDNIRAALKWAREQGKQGDTEAAEIGLRIAAALWLLWSWGGYVSEGREQLAGLLALPSSSTISGVQAPTAQTQSQSPRAPDVLRARALNGAGVLTIRQGDYDVAGRLLEESYAIWRQLGHKRGMALSLLNLGTVAYGVGDYAAGRSLCEASVAAWREIGDKWGISESLINLGVAVYMQKDYATARSVYEESLAIKREMGDKVSISISLNNLGLVAYSQGDYASARSLYEESLSIQRGLRYKRGTAMSLAGLGGVIATISREQQSDAQVEKGARLMGAAEALLKVIGMVLDPDDRVVYEQGIAAARAQLTEEEFEKAWAEGRAMNMEQAIEYALEEDQQ